jgi:hypothetical protein
VFENRVLRRILGPERNDVTGGWRKLKKELYNLYYSPNTISMIKSRRLRRTGHVECMWEMRNAYNILVGKLEGRRQLERSTRGWKNNIRMYLKEMG